MAHQKGFRDLHQNNDIHAGLGKTTAEVLNTLHQQIFPVDLKRVERSSFDQYFETRILKEKKQAEEEKKRLREIHQSHQQRLFEAA